jgi:hypothetical protein
MTKNKYTITWTQEQTDFLNKQKDQCIIYAYMHKESIVYYNRLSLTLNISNIILSAFATLALFSTSFLEFNSNIQLSIGFITAITTILSTINQTYDFAMTLEKHNIARITYSIINNDITEKLIVPNIKLEHRLDFINDIKERFNLVLITSPNIPRFVSRKHTNYLEISDMTFNNMNTIDKNSNKDVKINMDTSLPMNNDTLLPMNNDTSLPMNNDTSLPMNNDTSLVNKLLNNKRLKTENVKSDTTIDKETSTLNNSITYKNSTIDSNMIKIKKDNSLFTPALSRKNTNTISPLYITKNIGEIDCINVEKQNNDLDKAYDKIKKESTITQKQRYELDRLKNKV